MVLSAQPLQYNLRITSPTTGQQVPAGELTIGGNSSTDAKTDCEVFVDWNDLRPMQKVNATGPGGSGDYSNWTFT